MTTNLSGQLLIASPYLTDGNFMRSVIFIIRHDAQGAFGLAITRPTERRFRDLIDNPGDENRLLEDDRIYCGGPVEGPLLAYTISQGSATHAVPTMLQVNCSPRNKPLQAGSSTRCTTIRPKRGAQCRSNLATHPRGSQVTTTISVYC